MKKIKRYRDADTGQFVTKGYAEIHPKTTILDTMPALKKLRRKRKR